MATETPEQVDIPAPPPLADASTQPVEVVSRGLTVITQPGDTAEAQTELDTAASRLRPNEKPRISAPLKDEHAPAEQKKRPKALEPGGERFEEAQRQKRELHDRATKAEAEAAALKAKVAELERGAVQPPARVDPPAAAEPRIPAANIPDKFPTQEAYFKEHPEHSFDDFLNARDEWRDQRVKQTAKQAADQEAVNARVQKDLSRYAEQAAKIAEEESIDFAQTIGDGLKDVPFNPMLQAALFQNENGARIALQLAKNPDIAKRIAALNAMDDIKYEIGKVEGSLRSPRAGTTPTVKRTSAPPPFEPAGGGSDSQTTEDLFESAGRIGTMKSGSSLAEWERARKANGLGGRRRM